MRPLSPARAGASKKPLIRLENPRRDAASASICRESWYIGENKAHEARAVSQTPEDAPPPYFNISPDEALAELEPPVSTADFAGIARACAEGREDLIRRGHEAAGGRTLAPLLHLGDHPLPDPGGAAALPPGAARQPLPPPGPERDRRAAPSGSPSTRCCGCARISPPRAAAPRNTAPTARRACRPRSPPSPTSRAASARPRPRRTSPCPPPSTATGCWSSTSTARAR